MKTMVVNNQFAFGNSGGVRYLKIIKTNNGIGFVNTTKELSNVAVFVAGGSEIDKLVRAANIKATNKSMHEPLIAKKGCGILRFFRKLFNF